MPVPARVNRGREFLRATETGTGTDRRHLDAVLQLTDALVAADIDTYTDCVISRKEFHAGVRALFTSPDPDEPGTRVMGKPPAQT